MICPKCESKMGCYDSRPTRLVGADATRRRNKCTKCPHRITTYEIPAAFLEDALPAMECKMLRSQIRKIQEIINPPIEELI